MPRPVSALAVPALAVLALLAACGQPKEAEAPPEAAAPAERPSVVVGTPNGPVDVYAGAPVAAGSQPAFAPAYPGGNTVTTIAANENGKRGGVYAFTTTDAPDKVFEFYRSRAEAAGLDSQTNVDAGGSRIYGAQGPSGDLAVTAAPQGAGQTYVQVTWSTPTA